MRIICDKISLIWSSISWPFFCLRQVILKWQIIILQWRMFFMMIYKKKQSTSRICIKREPFRRLGLRIMKIKFHYSRGYWFHCNPKYQCLHFLHVGFVVRILHEPLCLIPRNFIIQVFKKTVFLITNIDWLAGWLSMQMVFSDRDSKELPAKINSNRKHKHDSSRRKRNVENFRANNDNETYLTFI